MSLDDWLVVSVFFVAGILVAARVYDCQDEPESAITPDFGVE